MASEMSLLLYTAPAGTFVLLLPKGANWRRSIQAQGGFWQGTCTLRGEAGPLVNAFYNWLGYHLVERAAGVVTWEGMVYELELTIGGVVRRRSLADLFNAVSTTYQANGEVAETGYSTQAQSITRYGRKEEKLLLDNYPLATAQAYRATFLADHAWPWPRPTSLGKPGAATLTITACGYAFTANWMFVEAGDATDDDLDDWMAEIVGAATGLSSNHGGAISGAGDCQFLKTGSLATNTLQATKVADSPARAWDVIAELAQLGDANGDPWRVWVDVGRLVHYAKISSTPRYFLHGGVLYSTAGAREAVTPWSVRPAVVRDLDYPVARAERGSWLDDARDLFVEEVEVDEAGTLSLRTAATQHSDIRAAQYAEYEVPEAEE